MKGSYILLIAVPEKTSLRTGCLGIVEFNPGYYAYVGSALNSLEKRILRHVRRSKKLFWHIDYLLEHADIRDVYCVVSPRKLECDTARKLLHHLDHMPGFGCSDCSCPSHLFFHADPDFIQAIIRKTLKETNLPVYQISCAARHDSRED
ncbi:GIY-YIG nuclease family protein [bacterium]|nr:GIY-YIG nuclease family protein [bacterium]